MHNIHIKKLVLENYRNLSKFNLETDSKSIVIIGENGTGKTNILEAISLLSPGRGLRSSAKLDEICQTGANYWQLQTIMQSKLGIADIRSGFKQGDRRWIEFNGSKMSNGELSTLVNVLWLTPQMDGIFLDGASTRRRFFDRIVYNFDAMHATKVSKYEYYVQERMKLLQQPVYENSWVSILEQQIAEVSAEITFNRLKILEQLQTAITKLDNQFPKVNLMLSGALEEYIMQQGETILTDEIAGFITSKLLECRTQDKLTKRTNFGIHRSDLTVVHQEKQQLAKFCSTGEQKAMLIAIILAQINSAIDNNLTPPIILLDEVFVHLDDRRRQYLIEFFSSINLQLFVTSTDLNGIESLAKQSEVIRL